MQAEAERLRAELTSMTSVLSDECGAALTPHQLKNLVGSEEVQQGLQLSDFFLEKRAGAGSFATVWRALYEGRRVALKQPHAKCSESDLVRFVREVQTLRSLDHPNIVRFVGAVWEPSLVMVLEWMSGGSVHQYLATAAAADGAGGAHGPPHHTVGGAALPLLSSSAVALDVARGMAYLHSLGHAHRDLKAAHVLLDGASPPTAKAGRLQTEPAPAPAPAPNPSPSPSPSPNPNPDPNRQRHREQVADFGLSRSLYAAGSLSRVGTPLWTAPELAGPGANYTLSCDVYSYAG